MDNSGPWWSHEPTILQGPAPVALKQPTSTSTMQPGSSLQAEGNHERPATAKVASEWLADAGPTLLIRQKFETTRKDPERKFERYESKEVCLAKVEDKTLLDDWYELKRTRPQDCEAISKLNHDNWEKEKLTRRLEKQEREEYQPQEEEHSSFDFEEHDSLCWRYRRFLQLFCGGCQTS